MSFYTQNTFSNSELTTSDLNEKLKSQFELAEKIAADQEIIKAVLDYNANKNSNFNGLTNDKWKTLSVIDPLVKSISKGKTTVKLKSMINNNISEAFINSSNGDKVAFLTKTSFWNHKGKDKHEHPMKGKQWQGKPEWDDSTGVNQIQISVPIMSNNKPIGSLILGVILSKL